MKAEVVLLELFSCSVHLQNTWYLGSKLSSIAEILLFQYVGADGYPTQGALSTVNAPTCINPVTLWVGGESGF